MKNASSSFDDIGFSSIKTMFEHTTPERMHRIEPNRCSIEGLLRLRQKWRSEGSVVVFTAGVFDILHVNHLLALTHYRLLAAQEYLNRKGASISEAVHDVAASDKVRFILSVDSDARVAADKAFVPSKGNCPKPLVSWRNRALLLARQQISKKDGSARPLIDYITMHGENSCNCASCPHDDNAYIAGAIEPDLIVVSSGSPATIQKLHESKALNKTKLIVIQEDKLSYNDAVLKGPIKSSAIIKRARSR